MFSPEKNFKLGITSLLKNNSLTNTDQRKMKTAEYGPSKRGAKIGVIIAVWRAAIGTAPV
jgi:hypothetical protein